jgi:hypothetical protein
LLNRITARAIKSSIINDVIFALDLTTIPPPVLRPFCPSVLVARWVFCFCAMASTWNGVHNSMIHERLLLFVGGDPFDS